MPSQPRQSRQPQSRRRSDRLTLAVLDERFESVNQTQERILHIIEGNGKPGLADRVTKVEAAQEQVQKDLSELMSINKGMTESVNRLLGAMETHVAPGNLQHATIAQAFFKNPAQLIKYAAWAVGIGFILLRTNTADELIKAFLGVP